MKKLAGTTWGANSDILKQVYTGAVRPVVEYASTIWDTASKTNKSKLDRVQNMGLRIILGAMRSTPIQQMEKTTDLQPLECRRIQSCHPRGKTEETPVTPPETSAWNQKPPEKKELQAQVCKKKLIFWRQIQKNLSVWAKSLPEVNEIPEQREHRLQNCRKHSQDDTESLSQEHLDPCLHRWLCRERC